MNVGLFYKSLRYGCNEAFSLYLVLFAFGCYSIFSEQLLVMQNVADGDQMECTLEKAVDMACCQANLEDSSEETCTAVNEDDASEKPFCIDHCCFVKIVKSPFIAVQSDVVSFPLVAIQYNEVLNFSFQQYTFNIFTAPQNIV
jgi:hypothetical protein